ncbi:glutathione S-transferase family protein [Hyphococcus lacteus]|uniref:Glutathione S-transferase family protein n=1 Tax=Hyphococcus lacteus TaxID=3143536 RepID=A0ABV3Z360_9PROT
MPEIKLTIGDKNLSSWSLRPWFLMKYAGIPFTEENIKLDRPESRAELNKKSPSGLVPFLQHGEAAVWDSLAISEYLNDQFPEKNLWPEAALARATARAVSAEMHSGFSALRTVWPMQVTHRDLKHVTSGGVQRDIDRINTLWTMCRRDYGKGGDFLFGQFSIADAMYAPVVSRLTTYGPVALSAEASAYRDMIIDLPVMKEWEDGARAEIGIS